MGFAPSGKSGKSMNQGICTFCTKRQKYESWDLHFLHKWQKWQKYESWDLHFLHQVAKVAKVRIMGYALFAPSGKSMNHENINESQLPRLSANSLQGLDVEQSPNAQEYRYIAKAGRPASVSLLRMRARRIRACLRSAYYTSYYTIVRCRWKWAETTTSCLWGVFLAARVRASSKKCSTNTARWIAVTSNKVRNQDGRHFVSFHFLFPSVYRHKDG